MLQSLTFTQLAARASNLAERLVLLKELEAVVPPDTCQRPLARLDLVQIDQDVERLCTPDPQAPSGMILPLSRSVLKRHLRQYRWYEINLDLLPAAACSILQQRQSSWLPTYALALEQLAEPMPDADRFLGGAPFIALLRQQMEVLCQELATVAHPLTISPQILAAAAHFFWARVKPMVTQAIASDQAQFTPLRESAFSAVAGDGRSASSLLRDYAAFYQRFPVLGRWLAQFTADFLQLMSEALWRLQQDQPQLHAHLLESAITGVSCCDLNLAYCPQEGQITIRFGLDLANGQTAHLWYFPYSIDAEVALQTLHRTLSGSPDPSPQETLLAQAGYGYSLGGLSEPQQTRFQSLQNLGIDLALRHVLGSHRGIWSRLHLGVGQFRPRLPHPVPAPVPPRTWAEGTVSNPHKAVAQGFRQVEQYVYQQPEAMIQLLQRSFRGATARLYNRPAAVYLRLLQQVQQPAYLRNPLQVDAVFRTLMAQPCPWDFMGELAQLEVNLLWQFKVPWLTVPMNHRYLMYSNCHALFSKLPLSPLEFMTQRIHQLSEAATPSQNPGEPPTLMRLLPA